MKHAALHSARRGAFTLIEVLTAAVAAAVILAALYGVFSRSLHLRDKATARTEDARVRARAANMLRADLRSAFLSGGKLAATLTGSRTAQNSQFPGYLRFSTTSGKVSETETVPAGDVQEVEYSIAADPASADRKTGMLVRSIYRNPLASADEVTRTEEMLGGVEAMDVSFFDGQSWTDSWEVSEDAPTLPKGIRVRLQMSAALVDPSPLEVTVPWTTAQMIPPANTATTGTVLP